jgi:hypothetical protein
MTTETITTETVSTGIITIDRESHRKACAYLKGFLIGRLPKRQHPAQARTPEFEQGLKDSRGETIDYYDGVKTIHLSEVTFAHIIHNRIRHRRPHLGSVEKDAAFLLAFETVAGTTKWGTTPGWQIRTTLNGFGINVLSIVKAGGVE